MDDCAKYPNRDCGQLNPSDAADTCETKQDRDTCADSSCNCGMTFSEALDQLKAGAAITRTGWNRSHMYLKLQTPDRYSKMTEPYIYMVITPRGITSIARSDPADIHGLKRVPWLASQTDLLSHDWILVAPQ